MPNSQTQDPHGSFKVSYPTTHMGAIWSRTLISTKRSILMDVFTGVNGVFRYFELSKTVFEIIVAQLGPKLETENSQ